MFEVVGQPAGGDLVGLVDEVAFGDQDQPTSGTDLGQHFGDVVEQPHRLLQLAANHLDHLGDDRRRNPPTADRDRGLDHRQAERLHAVSERGQVLALGRGERGLHVDALRGERRDQLDEPLLVGAEPVFAVPQGVVGVEPDHVEGAHSRLSPSISSSSPAESPA